jgi:hypothetical protein
MIVGDGPARRDVETIAAGLETTPGGDAPVVLIGEMSDPRVAYAAADIVLGMGSSALRAMAFAKPVVVQGESGFWSMLGPDTLDHFLWTGWYGVGASPEAGPRNLRDQLQPLIGDAQLRFELGRYALDVVTDRFSLAAASRKQVDHYAAELTRRLSTSRDVGDTAHSSALFARYQVGRRVQQLVGNAASDDFNARPVAAAATPRPETP